jgi:methyl-accepting chemotaxis protein
MTVERWTDEMLDGLASSVTELRESVTEVRESVTELRESVTAVRESVTELRESVTEVRDSVDGLRVTVQALLQVAAQSQRDMELMKQRQEENDQRFNILLEEVRYLRRGNQET